MDHCPIIPSPRAEGTLRNIICLASLLVSLSGCQLYYGVWFGGAPNQESEAKKAESLSSVGKYLEAIQHYKKHIENRFRDSRRLPNENPRFYNLYIGDLYIKLDRPAEAEEQYALALREEVDSKLVADRVIRLSRYFVTKGRYAQAIALLRKNRELDPDAFDSEIDETHKKSVAAEDRVPRRQREKEY